MEDTVSITGTWEHVPRVPASQQLHLRTPACLWVLLCDMSHAQSRQAGVQVSTQQYRQVQQVSHIPSGTERQESSHYNCKQAMSYTDVWKRDRKLCLPPPAASQMSKDRLSLSFLTVVSPAAPIPALILLLARRGHRSLVSRLKIITVQDRACPCTADTSG